MKFSKDLIVDITYFAQSIILICVIVGERKREREREREKRIEFND